VSIGHTHVVEALQGELPPVTLFLGPASVGKATIAAELFARHGISGTRLFVADRLDVDVARDAAEFCRGRGHRGVLLGLDAATTPAVNVLLKPLEAPPREVHFILVSSEVPIETVTSRAQVYRFGFLSEDEVARVLIEIRGVSRAQAEAAAKLSGGQVRPALGALLAGDSRGPILTVLRAVAEGDEELFYATMGGKRLVRVNGHEERRDAVDAQQLGLLRTWALEARTGRWRLFSRKDSYGLDTEPAVIDRVLRATSRPTRPKVAVRAALLPLVWEHAGRVRVDG
jgi:hypothetical protein